MRKIVEHTFLTQKGVAHFAIPIALIVLTIVGFIGYRISALTSAAAPTFGRTTVGPTIDTLSRYYKVGTPSSPATSGKADSIKVYLDGKATKSGSASLAAALYADAAGKPSSLLGASNAQTISAGRSAGWVTFTLKSQVSVTAGTKYWIAVTAGGDKTVARLYRGNTSNAQGWARNSSGSTPTSTFGTITFTGGPISAYVSYTETPVATPPPAPTPTPTPEPTPTPPPATGTNSGGSGGPQTDRLNGSYTANGITSQYHLYASGLDWTKKVGLMIYGDGSAEYGLKNPTSTYLLAGTDGLVNVAKRNNMLLLTPLAPGTGCPDGDGTCWYATSSGITKKQKTEWAEALTKYVQTQYPVELTRIAMGGYSSGAQLASRQWVPSGAAQRTMADGVIVSISCGGNPDTTAMGPEVEYTPAFKANVHLNWNSGDKDAECPHTSTWSTMGGYNHYTAKGLLTSVDLLPGVTHDRTGQFGAIMEAQIKEHVVPAE